MNSDPKDCRLAIGDGRLKDQTPGDCRLAIGDGRLKDQTPARILVLGDSVVPGLPGAALTGFGRVLLNVFTELEGRVGTPGLPVDFWAINFGGYNYKALAELHPSWTLIPAGYQGWNSPQRLGAFLSQLENGNYTHLFMLMDPDAVSGDCLLAGKRVSFPQELKRLCREKKTKSLLYYPVDAPLQPPFDIIEAVDQAVTFTEYGCAETRKAMGRSLFPVKVIPHGIDAHFTPLTAEERAKNRAEFAVLADGHHGETGKLVPFVGPGDFLMLNVNKNEWRKDPLRSLEILKGLREAGVPAKLVLRMDPTSHNAGVNLERAAEQLGLTLDKEWAHIGPVPEEHMRGLYGAADLLLSTSLGEGWGFSLTEALGCGTPVAVPDNSSMGEIVRKIVETDDPLAPEMILLGLETGAVCGYDNRLRHRVHLAGAVAAIMGKQEDYGLLRGELSGDVREWLSWARVAGEFAELMGL